MTRYIQRHSRLARVTHGVAAVSCIFLALTGVAVFTPAISEALGGTFVYWMRMLHRIAAVPFILFPLIALVRSPKGAAHLFKNNIFGKWDKDDWEFARKFVPYLFNPQKVHMPPQHEVKGAQRMADGGLVIMGILMALSGLVMWAEAGWILGSTGIAMSASLIWAAHIIHDIGFLVIIVFGLGHIYLGAGIFQPYKGTANLMWGDGKVSEADAAYHWGYWANTRLGTGEGVTTEKK